MTEANQKASRWDQILLAWLHDPPDKALSILGHVARAGDNAKVGLGVM
jgi:CRISPR-associated protein Cmr2